MTADRLDFFGNGQRAAPLGALEGHMLQHMGDAVDLRRLVAGAGIDPDADRDGLDLRHGLGNDPQAVGERTDTKGHAVTRWFSMKSRTTEIGRASCRERVFQYV